MAPPATTPQRDTAPHADHGTGITSTPRSASVTGARSATGAGPAPESPRLRPEDSGYPALAARGNRRFQGRPAVIRPVSTTQEVVAAVQEAVDAGHRLTVRSGGHALEDLTDHADVHTLLDASRMRHLGYDQQQRAFVVEPGVTLGELYGELAEAWGVTLPGGLYPGVGVGGHLVGGGYGYLSRLHGLAVDHLHAVEVVVVDAEGRARAVLAGREGPHRDLWWAHTGGGGGSFGVVTRYWLRTPGTADEPPRRQLPSAPGEVLRFVVSWTWDELDEQSFERLVANHGRWAERESMPGSPYAGLHSEFYLWRRPFGSLTMEGIVAAASSRPADAVPDGIACDEATSEGGAPDEGAEGRARAVLDRHLAEIGAGTGLSPAVTSEWIPWMRVFARGEEPEWGQFRMKVKDAYVRRPMTADQIRTVHRHLAREDVDAPGAALSVHTYGGAINAVEPTATAVSQRDSILKLVLVAVWGADGTDEEQHLRFLRELYRDLFAESGGVPLPGEHADGAYLNHPDLDLADPAWNTSGVRWQELYHGGNLARLQQVKAAWDPRNVFHHALSVQAEPS